MKNDKNYYDEKVIEVLSFLKDGELEIAEEIIRKIEYDYSHGLQRYHDISAGISPESSINIINYDLSGVSSYIAEYIRLYFDEKGCNVSLDSNKRLIIDKSGDPDHSIEQIIDTDATR